MAIANEAATRGAILEAQKSLDDANKATYDNEPEEYERVLRALGRAAQFVGVAIDKAAAGVNK